FVRAKRLHGGTAPGVRLAEVDADAQRSRSAVFYLRWLAQLRGHTSLAWNREWKTNKYFARGARRNLPAQSILHRRSLAVLRAIHRHRPRLCRHHHRAGDAGRQKVEIVLALGFLCATLLSRE